MAIKKSLSKSSARMQWIIGHMQKTKSVTYINNEMLI